MKTFCYNYLKYSLFVSFFVFSGNLFSQTVDWKKYNIVWNSQSKNSAESMPCGGGDIGTNVWVENGELFLYLSRSGAFDENGIFPKLGRVRVKLSPNPFANGEFRQELDLEKGCVSVSGKSNGIVAKVKIWVDVFNPAVHIELNSNKALQADAIYETWRNMDYQWTTKQEFNASRAYVNAPVKVIVRKDSILFENNRVLFYHRNRDESIFDMTVSMQGLDKVKNQLWNPLKGLTFGGCMEGDNMKPSGTVEGKYAITPFTGFKLSTQKPTTALHLRIFLHRNQTMSALVWKDELNAIVQNSKQNEKQSELRTREWWKQYFQRSYIAINANNPDTASKAWQVGRNYNVFRYQLGCNAYGNYPTKFNGGLFTTDPCYVDAAYHATPDHRDWGGVTFTAQNQRLLYWPMLKSGDFDMLAPQLDFYVNMMRNAEIRSEVYWGHKGAAFTEQIECFGLPVAFEYGWKRPQNYPEGVEYNNWLEYLWDTSLEFCLIAMDKQQFTGQDITKYIPLIESCLTFFDEHYQKEALLRGRQALDGAGKLILYPGTGAETYKMAYNSTSTIAGLQTVLTRLLELPEKYVPTEKRIHWKEMLKRIPPIAFREKEGHKTISPAWTWARINNQEIPQLYPVFPYGMYGIFKPDLEVAINTWKYGTDEARQKNHISWHQDAIFCARLGLTGEAAANIIKKLQDSKRRFPTFWGPGHDWVPDHNWGGSGMIALQEMLMQTDGSKIYLFPAWPKEWNVQFKLHAPYNTTVEGVLENGKIRELKVTPEARISDVISMIK